jgi:hypothetical protein
MKQGSLFVLFCIDEIHSTRMLSDHVLGLFGKLSRRWGASAWFHVIWTCGAKVFEY